jgi:polyisoprenoid-binding protein YceI
VGTHPRSKAPVAGFGAELTIKRSDFGVNTWADAAGVLGDEVKVTLLIEAVTPRQ